MYFLNKRINNFTNNLKYLYQIDIISNSFWALIGDIISKGLIFVSFIAIARILGKDGYGQFGILRTTIAMFAVLGGMGLGLTNNKYVALNKNKDKEYCGDIIGLSNIIAIFSGIFFTSLVFFGAKILGENILKTKEIIVDLKISSIILLFNAINGSQIGVLQGLESYKSLAVANFLQGITAMPLFIIGSILFGVRGAILGYAINQFLYTLFLHTIVKKELKNNNILVNYKKLDGTVQILWKFSLPAALTGIVIAPFKWLSEAIIINKNGYSELGIFQAAFLIVTVVISVTSTINSPLISVMSNRNEGAMNQNVKYFSFYGTWYLFLLLAIPLLLFPKLLFYLFGSKFNDPHLIITNSLLLLYTGMMMYYQGIVRSIIVNDSIWYALFTNIIEGLILIGVFYLVKKYDSIGLGIAYCSSYIGRIIISLPYILRRKIITRNILIDKYFISSFLLVIILVIYQSIKFYHIN